MVVQNNGKKVCCTCKVVFCCQLPRSNESIKIRIDISIKRVNLIWFSDTDCIDKSIEIDETLVPFIHLSRFLPISPIYIEDTSIHQKLKTEFMQTGEYICWQLLTICSWGSKDQTILTFKNYHLFKSFLFFQTGFKIILWWLILARFAGAQLFTT